MKTKYLVKVYQKSYLIKSKLEYESNDLFDAELYAHDYLIDNPKEIIQIEKIYTNEK